MGTARAFRDPHTGQRMVASEYTRNSIEAMILAQPDLAAKYALYLEMYGAAEIEVAAGDDGVKRVTVRPPAGAVREASGLGDAAGHGGHNALRLRAAAGMAAVVAAAGIDALLSGTGAARYDGTQPRVEGVPARPAPGLAPAGGRNAPCPCGSGRKWKACCRKAAD